MGISLQQKKVYNFTTEISIDVRNEVFEFCRLPIDIEWGYEDDTFVYGIVTYCSEISDDCLYDVGDSIERILRKMSGLPDW